MTKGTPSKGKKAGGSRFVTRCRRCGKRSYHIRHKRCSSCGFGRSSKLRKYSWQKQRHPIIIKKKSIKKLIK